MKSTRVIGGRLEMGSSPIPICNENQVLIKICAAGVNRADLFQREGKYPPPEGASDVLGLEVSGVIHKIGAKVVGFEIGDEVCALLEGGGYAEYAAVNAGQVLSVPKIIRLQDAAALPEAIFTVWYNLFMCSDAKKGDRVLIHGGASGIGVMAIQIANAFGIKVFTTAGSDEKCQFLEKLGAYKAVNYKKYDFVEILGKNSVDIVLDIVGGDYFQKNLSVLDVGGRIVCLSFLGGAKSEVNFAPIVFKDLQIMGSTLRNKSAEIKAQICSKVQENILPLIESGQVKPIIHQFLSINDAQAAHEIMQSNANIGKLVLVVS